MRVCMTQQEGRLGYSVAFASDMLKNIIRCVNVSWVCVYVS